MVRRPANGRQFMSHLKIEARRKLLDTDTFETYTDAWMTEYSQVRRISGQSIGGGKGWDECKVNFYGGIILHTCTVL